MKLINFFSTPTEHEHAVLILEDFGHHEIAGETGIAIPTAGPFNDNIHEVSKDLVDYNKIISHPMDLIIIRNKLETDKYNSFDEFAVDIRLIFSNCLQYNQSRGAFEIRAMANTLSHYFETVVAAITGKPRKAM